VTVSQNGFGSFSSILGNTTSTTSFILPGHSASSDNNSIGIYWRKLLLLFYEAVVQ
jgi:hypothetical protein